MKVTCAECYFEFDVDEDVMLGEVLECPDCSCELEVIEVKKNEIIVQKAESEDEDWGE